MSRTKTNYGIMVTVNISDFRESVDLYCATEGTTMTMLLESNDISSSFFKTSILKYNKEHNDDTNTKYGIVRVSRFNRICDLIGVNGKNYIVEEEAQNEPDNSVTDGEENCVDLLKASIELQNKINENLKNLGQVMLAVMEELRKFNE